MTSTTTTTTTDTVETTAVTPGKVTVEMKPVETKGKDEVDVDVTGATVIVKNDKTEDGKYSANIKLNLSGRKLEDGSVTLTVQRPDGTEFEKTLNVDENGNYTLEGIDISGLTGGSNNAITLTLTGTQIEKVVDSTTRATEKPEKNFWSFDDASKTR